MGGVPGVVAVCPGEAVSETVEHVVEGPGYDHNVVGCEQEGDHYCGYTSSWGNNHNVVACEQEGDHYQLLGK